MRRELANRFASWEDLSPHGSCFYCIPIRAGRTGQVVIVFAEQAKTRDEVTNSRTCTRMVVPPTIDLEPLVAYAFEMGGHTYFMMHTIGAYAQSGGNPRHLHSFLVTLKRDYLFWYWRAATE